MDEYQEKPKDEIISRKIEKEMRESYIKYAMSVIVSRALPDVRDGLKPVHRRILHTMNELNLDPSKPYKKSARIVGDAMGKYHPHGDSSIYDALVRMAQDFSMRYMLVDGHGNFGSMDGDSAAAQRYTEARMSRMATEMLADIEKDTVDFVPNYDEEEKEPTVLPARYPNLLVNGSSGIAVGMATNIPPHNLTEAIDAVVKIIDNQTIEKRETDITELLEIVKGPDFPTGATILGTNGAKSALMTGRGRVIMQADCDIQPMGTNREMIVVSSVPYQVNKARLVEKIGELIKEKRVEGITDLRDESDRNGIRIVIELKNGANSNVVLNNLYKYSQLRETFSVNTLALVNGEPKTLNLLQMLNEFIKHQREVVTRRTRFELNKAQARAHILKGLIVAIDNIDEVIKIIRGSSEVSEAVQKLIDRFELSKIQAEAIVEMRLRRLTGLERDKLEKEFNELQVEIERLTGILADEDKLYAVIREEILLIKQKYGDERRTKIVPYENEIELEDLIDEETSVITMSHLDYIKRIPLAAYKTQNRGGRGVIGMTTRDEDLIKSLFIASTHDDIMFFTTRGKVFRIRAYTIPEAGRQARGTAIVNLLQLQSDEKIAAVIPVREYDGGYLTMATKAGVIKKTPLDKFGNIKKSGIIALNIRDDDELISVLKTTGQDEVFIATKNGMGIRFDENDIRSSGRTSTGVRGIRLRAGDEVIGAVILKDDMKALLVSSGGFGKCTENDMFRNQTRGGVGVRVYKTTEKTGALISVATVNDKEELMLINSEGIIIRIKIDTIRTTGRNASGVKLINLNDGVSVVGIAKIAEEDAVGDEDEEAVEEIVVDDVEEANPEVGGVE